MVMPVLQPERLSGMEEKAFNCELGDEGSGFVLLRQLFSQVPIMMKELTRSVFPKMYSTKQSEIY